MTGTHHDSTTIASTKDQGKANLWSLVLRSVDIRHSIIPGDDGYRICVPNGETAAALRQLTIFEEENKNWPPPTGKQLSSNTPSFQQPPIILLMGILVIIYAVTGPWTAGSPWFQNGAVKGKEILNNGEWWRVVTALTLHSNSVHLLGNTLIGGFLVYFLLRAIGNGWGLALLLSGGAIGNSVNIMVHGTTHNSVGFSTAVFAVIGILTGRQCILKKKIAKTIIPPLAAGIGLLAMLGASGEHTDLGAHLFGLAAGLGLGIIFTLLPNANSLISSRRLQSFLFMGSLCLVIICWLLAFNSSP
jgi:membrane associated rhomboid family serine protease